MKDKKKFKIKQVFKNSIFTFILGALIFGVAGVGAASVLYSKDVTYDNSSSGMSAITVQAALDELYAKAKSAPSCDSNGVCTVTCPSDKPDYVATSTGYRCAKTAKGTLLKNVVTSGSGLYADSVESGRYIYRGASPNNYITFNGESAGWRIISVESDGTIKIIRNSTLSSTMVWDTPSARSAMYCNRSSSGCNSWGSSSTTLNALGTKVTSMPYEYGGAEFALPTIESTLNKYLNGTYYNGLSSTAKSQIASHTFNIGVVSSGSGQTIATEVIKESTYKWKGKIALANVTDYERTSTNTACTGRDAYTNNSSCYNNISTHNWMYYNSNWWTLSPDSNPYSTEVWYVASDGRIINNGAYNAYGVRPALYLRSDITLSGNGTSSAPYTITG